MSRSQITFTLGQGTLNNPATGTDYISGIQFYGSTTYLGSFGATPCQAVFSLSDAENKGITNDYADETQATGIVTISGTLAAGDTLGITVAEPNPNGTSTLVNLGTGIAPATPTATTFAAAVVTAINALTYSHGYSASNTAGAITITARKGTGVSLNSVSPGTPHTGAGTYTVTQPFGSGLGGAVVGVYSQKAIWHYHVSEFFRANPNGKLWVRVTSTVDPAYADITSLQNTANGECMRIGVYSFVAKTIGTAPGSVASDLGLMQAQADSLFTAYRPAAIFFAPNIKAINDVSTLPNLQSVTTAKSCYCVIGQDGAAVGAQLFVNSGVSISNIGCILGTSSAASVSQDIGEIGAFNLTDGLEMNVPAFSNGVLVSSVASSFLDTMDAYRYGFCVNQTGYPGTFVNNDWTAIANTNAYNRLGRILTIYKVERQQYIALLPLLKSRIYLNADGTMTQTTIEQYIGAAEPRIAQMVKDGDLSPGNMTGASLTSGVVSIDPTQNVNSQGYVSIVYNLLGVNIADNINVTLQFTQKLS